MARDFASREEKHRNGSDRGHLSADLLEDIGEGMDSGEGEPAERPPGEEEVEALTEGGTLTRVPPRSALELEELGRPRVEKGVVEMLGLEEGIDDPVRMYLREIGKVHLLT